MKNILNHMTNKRTTIYDLAKAMNLSASYISKALNNHPSVREEIREKVRAKAKELNYSHNSYAANLRRGSSHTVGVVVPYIRRSFFAKAIAGIEEVCTNHGYGVIICQSQDSFERECHAIKTLVRQNVDAIFMSVAAETQTYDHLLPVIQNGIKIVQFDRTIEDFKCAKVMNDNERMAYDATMHLVSQGYKKIAYLGGTQYLSIYNLRKKGYLTALQESGLPVYDGFICDNTQKPDATIETTKRLLTAENRPDAFVTVSDEQATHVLLTALDMGFKIPEEVGVIGFGNDETTLITRPTISSVDQKSFEHGLKVAELYFDLAQKEKEEGGNICETEIIPAEVIARGSSKRR